MASFSSPCVLPLVPAYLSVIAGLDVTGAAAHGGCAGPGGELPASRRVGEVALNASLFVAGFGTVFVLLGLSASSVGRAVLHDPMC